MRALNAVSPLATLERGYAIVTHARSGHALLDSKQLSTGDKIEARLATGSFAAGFVLWTARTGYLVAMLSSSLPTWASLDPIPVLDAGALERRDKRKTNRLEQESLVNIVEGQQM
jgi:hypothetical protein